MKHLVYLFLILLFTCKPPDQTGEQEVSEKAFESHPEEFQEILKAHGGLNTWQKMRSMTFEIVKEDGNEKHFVNLQDRRDRVEGLDFTMGFDGTDVWLEADTSYNGDPEFYHNLMFYFYAMPFVLADPGINYQPAEIFEFDGISWPGIHISYDQGIGTSSKDEYFLYYHPETYRMEWLGYTVTYFSNDVSEDVHWIRYSDWEDFNGLKLPVALTWYEYQEGIPTEPRNRVDFVNTAIQTTELPESLFNGP